MITFRPIVVWPYPNTPDRRSRHVFKSSWSATMALLDRELRLLDASNVLLGAGFREQDIRLDGLPRSGAWVPEHPGVELSFDSKHGRLVYATDATEFWESNVRSLALGLEALRAVDRYGITQTGQQYAGFKALPPGDDPRPDRGRELIEEHGGIVEALKATHPDHGGDPRDFADVQAARQAA